MLCRFENKKTMGQMVAECSDGEYVTLAKAEIETEMPCATGIHNNAAFSCSAV
jgi:hypothetical protein